MMKQFGEAIQALADVFNEKGYNGTFLTHGRHAGDLKKSISNYLTETGSEKADGIILDTFLQDAADRDQISATFYTNFNGSGFEVKRMDMALYDNQQQFIRSMNLHQMNNRTIPAKSEATAKIRVVQEPNIKQGKGLKI